MTDEKTSIGFAVLYKHVSGTMKLSTVCKTSALAKANYLNDYFINVDSSWTAGKVEEAWNKLKPKETQIVELYVLQC